MSSVTELYSSVYEKLKSIHARYENAESQLDTSVKLDEATRQRRIENLQQQLEKIDEYETKVEAFRQLAEKHLTSRNLLTITPRELNFNRMRNWAMMIDPLSSDDPYAQRIYVQAQCNAMFLRQKRAQFQHTLAALTGQGVQDEDARCAVEKLRKELVEECRAVIESEEFDQLALTVKARHNRYAQTQDVQAVIQQPPEDPMLGIGVYACGLPIFQELRYSAKVKLNDYYDVKSSSILLPVEHIGQKERLIQVSCTGAKAKKLYRGLQNYLLNVICKAPIGSRKICFLDALHYNNSALGFLRPLEDSLVLSAVPKDAEQVLDTLKGIVSSFSDMDETMGMAESVAEYNQTAEAGQQLARTVLVLVGYPSAYGAEAKQLIQRILYNYEHYGVTVIMADTQYVPKAAHSREEIPVDLVENVYQIRMTQQQETIRQDGGTAHHFRWYELRQELFAGFISHVRSFDAQNNTLGTVYTNRVAMDHYPAYERGKKSIVVPYGVDARDEVHSICFDNENFAAYLMGASGSGKSTLLHTIITGILRDYHPDDVELWLADFKMSEFAQYMDPLPPHVKYILLDESPELVYDLLDRLTEKMMERQRFFMKHRDMKKVENVPTGVYMPVIFVILDEFSIMSQAVSESEVYKLRLQNLLAKGRALGIKFIFASQTFTKGVAGLTQTAKDQIQTRIAMKNSYSEINETLELSSGIRTEQVKNWMEALPPHYTLHKYRDGDSMKVQRLQVMYFKGKGDEALEPQRKLIRHRRETMRPVPLEEYTGTDPDTYVDKKPVIVDGNSYKAFHQHQAQKMIDAFKQENQQELSGDDVVVSFGAPRRMENARFAVITNESRENLLLVARSAEQACGMSLIKTAMESFKLQNGRVQVWAYNKNRLYRTYKDGQFGGCQVAEGMEAICVAIRGLKDRIARKETGKELIVLLGMETICSDFELIDFGGSVPGGAQLDIDAKQYEVKDEAQQAELNDMLDLRSRFEETYDLETLEEEWMEQGMSFDEILEREEKLYEQFLAENGAAVPEQGQQPEEVPQQPQQAPEEPQSAAYNALEDFKYILRQGSRFGYHFLLQLSTLSDLKATGLQQDLFRHRLAFQLSGDDSYQLMGSKVASRLPEHICQYTDSLEQYSLRPYIHGGIGWDGWEIGIDGQAINA